MSSEIRDKTKSEIWKAITVYAVSKQDTLEQKKCVEHILAINSLAVADRDAKLPEKEFISSNENYRYREAQQDMLLAGWVREIKE